MPYLNVLGCIILLCHFTCLPPSHRKSSSYERSLLCGESLMFLSVLYEYTLLHCESEITYIKIYFSGHTEWKAVGLCQIPVWCNGAADTPEGDRNVPEQVLHLWCSSALQRGDMLDPKYWCQNAETVEESFTAENYVISKSFKYFEHFIKEVVLWSLYEKTSMGGKAHSDCIERNTPILLFIFLLERININYMSVPIVQRWKQISQNVGVSL